MKFDIELEDIKKMIEANKEKEVIYIDSTFGDYTVKNVPWIKSKVWDEHVISAKTFDRVYELVAELRNSGTGFEVEYSDKK
jgi:histidinol-phosphate/aromatic aminotransferase/cobyric acid decarboxylase-like protein